MVWLEGSKDRCPTVRGDSDRKGQVEVDWGLSGQCQGHSSLDAPSELNPPQRVPSPLFVALLVPQAEG